MNIKEFTALAAAEVLQYLPEDMRDSVSVETQEVMKVNDQVMHGLAFHQGDKPAPTFYLDELFEIYLHGAGLEELLRGMARTYAEAYAGVDFSEKAAAGDDTAAPVPIEVPDLRFRTVKRRTGVRLLGVDYNKKYLQTVPFRDVGNGYVLIADAQIKASDGGVFSTVITNSMAEEYEYDMDVLFNNALDTAWQTNAARFMPAEKLIDETAVKEDQESCWVLTADRPRFGAAALFYPGTQEMIAHVLGEGYFAIPSSLHEFIIMRESQVSDQERLRRLVIEANRTIVSPDEVLSDNLLYYSRSTGELSLVQPAEDYADFAE